MLRPIKLQENELQELQSYSKELGYELSETSNGIWMLKNPVTLKRVFLQRVNQQLIVVSDEAIQMDASSVIVEDFQEDLTMNITIYKAFKSQNKSVRNGVSLLFSKLFGSNNPLKEATGIVSLEFQKI